jgi:hypothetical protein
MQRRTLLGLGVAGVAALSMVGVGASWMYEPAWHEGQLRPAGRAVLRAVANAVLDGSLSEEPRDRDAALDFHLQRMETTIDGLPVHVQDEVAMLLGLLSVAPLRRALGGLALSWTAASIGEVQAALESMRASSLMVRRQAYGALRDLTHAAYFSDPSTWTSLRYPGPRAIG